MAGTLEYHLLEGARLANEGYNQDSDPQKRIPVGFVEFCSPINDGLSGLQVKFLLKDSTVYVLVAGTNQKRDIPGNWFSKGANQFRILDPILRQVIIDARERGFNVVIAGDSGGGLVVQHAYYKYGIDGYMTNTAGIWKNDERLIQKSDIWRPGGKVYTSIYDGEALSSTLGYPSIGEVFIIPSKEGAFLRYLREELGMSDFDSFLTAFQQGVYAHTTGRQLAIQSLQTGVRVFRPDELNFDTYQTMFPWLLPAGAFSSTPSITRYRDSNDEYEYLQGYLGYNMNKRGLAAVLGVSPDQIERAYGGYFRVRLEGISEENISAALEWFRLKTESRNLFNRQTVTEPISGYRFDSQTQKLIDNMYSRSFSQVARAAIQKPVSFWQGEDKYGLSLNDISVTFDDRGRLYQDYRVAEISNA